MARNVYFSDRVKSEQDLYEDLVIESMKIYGQDIYYLPRTIVNEDSILGDDIPSLFSSAYKVEMYIENVDGFAGEGDLFQKFGIEIRDQATFVVSRRRWSQTVSSYNNNIEGDLPIQGDLIYLPLTGSLFQIMHVERESPFYQLSNLNVVRLECELFEYNDETMDTGVPEIDAIEELGYTLTLTIDSPGAIAPEEGDIVYQTLNGVTITANVLDWNADTNEILVAHIGADDGTYHEFLPANDLFSQNSAGQWTVNSISESLGSDGYQNDVFDSDVDDYLDFSESNPFGDPS